MSQMWDRRRHSRWPGDRRTRRSSAGDPWPRAPAPQTAFCDHSLPALPVPRVRRDHDGRALGGRGLASVRASGPLLGARALRPRRAAGSRGPSARLPGPARRRQVAVASARSLDRSACGRTRRPARASPGFRAARGHPRLPPTAALAQDGRPSAGKVTLTTARRHVTALRLETRAPAQEGREGGAKTVSAPPRQSRAAANSLAGIVSASATHGQALRMRKFCPAAIAGASARAWLTSAALQPRSTRRRSVEPPARLSRPAAAARYWSAIAGSAECPGESVARQRQSHMLA